MKALTIAAIAILVVAGCGSPPPAASTNTQAPPSARASAVEPTPSPSSSAAPSAIPDAVDLPTVGTLVFHRYDDADRAHLWTSCPDLTNLREVPGRDGYSAGWPVWSPDGSRIAFNANYEDPDPKGVDDRSAWDIYTMDRDGGDVRKLTSAVGLLGDPDYSPDGKLIAYTSDEPGDEGVWVMNAADGSDPRRVTARPPDARVDYAARFSPDGSHLVFTREVSDTEAALWLVGVDGTGLERLTPATQYPEKGDWAPDGTRIAFVSVIEGVDLGTIWTIEPDGTNLTNITGAPSAPGARDGYSHAVWSPDGSLILSVHGLHPGPSRLGFAVTRPDGTGHRWISDGAPKFEKVPDWTAAAC